MWTLRPPFHWTSLGETPNMVDVKWGTEEGAAVSSYFLEWMPQGTELLGIQRWESQRLYMQFDSWKQSALQELGQGWKREDVESWLFHGTDSVDEVLKQGFKVSTVNLKRNKYGAGVYFARDPRLAHYFIRRQRGEVDNELRIILARVVVGQCKRKKALYKEAQLKLQEHREPPPGYHSTTSQDAPGREIVTYPGNPGAPAYPAYVLRYTTQLRKDPYKDLVLARMPLGWDRQDAHVFERYKRWYRPGWSCQSDSAGNPQEFDTGPTSSAAPPAAASRPPAAASPLACKAPAAPSANGVHDQASRSAARSSFDPGTRPPDAAVRKEPRAPNLSPSPLRPAPRSPVAARRESEVKLPAPTSGGAPPLMVTGCTNQTVANIIKGTYVQDTTNHNKPVYKKQVAPGSHWRVFIYFWDERVGSEFSGWWFGPKVGGDQVWAYNGQKSSLLPPRTGWKVPWDGPKDHSLQILLGPAPRVDKAVPSISSPSSPSPCLISAPERALLLYDIRNFFGEPAHGGGRPAVNAPREEQEQRKRSRSRMARLRHRIAAIRKADLHK